MKHPDARLYRAQDYPRMPWRNGGGITQEVACNPGGSSAAFDWRLSIAEVAQDGGFSSFSGLQRIITVLEGAGIALTVDGQAQAPLGPRQAYAFSGDAAVDCRLVNGPIRDFNLIYSPARYHARLQWVTGVGDWAFHSSARSVLVLNAAPLPMSVNVGDAWHDIPSCYDCLQIDARPGLHAYRLRTEGALDACLIELTPCNR
ncbi:Protein Ves [Achromobacter deleyi]|uniref:Protein Ves n=1 Tax=Achromobacter deleyi TaxID=1353891 RepID=A0A6S7ACD3_9BURK|nr:HutD family protein [Achromobacter deleyi]CAB3712267.1 Protein Ves [Achromobacter deleyi]CAB3885642.1 Protein Ves [Achromobacter deleyi]CAB3902028.1 Protein Ves [Achromobacter deleyi]CAB3920807.1 Protein Ves [Achromobacter deleyi]